VAALRACTQSGLQVPGIVGFRKRGIMGTFHKVSTEYLPLCMAEFQFRYNQRGMPGMFGVAIARC